MQLSSIGVSLAPLALLFAAFTSWSVISFLFIVIFLFISYKSQWQGFYPRAKMSIWKSVMTLALFVVLIEVTTLSIWAFRGNNWNASNWSWFRLLGLERFNPFLSVLQICISIISQLAVAATAACAVYHEQNNDAPRSCRISGGGSQCRIILRNLVLPAVQLTVGVARPCWISLPFFICSCAGLLHWSTTGNCIGLAWGWQPLLLYTALDIVILYCYQFPVEYPSFISSAADYLGFYKVSNGFRGWPEILQGISLLAFYVMLCVSIYDLKESVQWLSQSKDQLPTTCNDSTSMFKQHSTTRNSLTERLLSEDSEIMPSGDSTSRNKESSWLQFIMINFFVYGFPICLIALVLWSFAYKSICAFIVLLYVGYTIFAFPSVHSLRILSVSLLAFILLWAMSTYVFNAAFAFLKETVYQDTKLWDTIGLWHYSSPGLFLLAQFCLSVLVGASILATDDVRHRTDEVGGIKFDAEDNSDHHDKKVLVLAILSWIVRRTAHSVSLILLFLVGVRHGLMYAIYMVFFLIYLLSSKVARSTRQYLVLLCEIHIGILFLLRLGILTMLIEKYQEWLKPILTNLGLSDKAGLGEYLTIAALLIFSAVQNHGFKLLLTLSDIVRRSAYAPLGFGIFKSRSNSYVIISVYAATTESFDYIQEEGNSTVKWIANKLAHIREAIRTTYRSFGTYIAFLAVLMVVFKVGINYISFGYIALLLFWIVGRQLLGRTKGFLWFPMFGYAVLVFSFHYTLSCFPELQEFISHKITLYPDLGFQPKASTLANLWDSMAILVVMQLFRFERSQKPEQGYRIEEGDYIESNLGLISFSKRFLILHSGKVLIVTVFYASISPVSAVGFVYLLMLVFTSIVPKSSRFPARLFASYTALIICAEFLFQKFGGAMEMYPEQVHGSFASWLGFRVFAQHFRAIEAGLRSRVLVLAACLLQYSAFFWLEHLPASLRNDGQVEEPCFLFLPYPRRGHDVNCAFITTHDNCRCDPDSISLISARKRLPRSRSLDSTFFSSASVSFNDLQEPSSARNENKPLSEEVLSSYTSVKQRRQWSKRTMLILRNERYIAQLRTIKIYSKYLIENFFNLYGLEINMLVLLVSSFAVLNVISLLYVLVLILCILLKRPLVKQLWPLFVVLFASVLLVEYVALGRGPPPWDNPHLVGKGFIRCHHCADDNYPEDFNHCRKCWLGVVVDDRQMLTSYFLVFIFACFKLRSNMLANQGQYSSSINTMISQSDRIAWKEISYETRGQWTWIDQLRFLFYRHLLDAVLVLLLITGTLEYDFLHLGYLAFALLFFRMRVTILKKGTGIFGLLRLYNFVLIILSLFYQAPFFGHHKTKSNAMPECLYEAVGLNKFTYGLDIASRSALVDITIFCLVGLQSSIFRSKEFEQVLRYLEAEEVDVKLQAQERKATWKTEQLQRIREVEEQKQHRREQVEKIKMEMPNLQFDVDVLNSPRKIEFRDPSRSYQTSPISTPRSLLLDDEQGHQATAHLESSSVNPMGEPCDPLFHGGNISTGVRRRAHVNYTGSSPVKDTIFSVKSGKTPQSPDAACKNSEILELETSKAEEAAPPKIVRLDSIVSQGLRSSVQILEDSITQVQIYGNKALASLVDLLKTNREDSDDNEGSTNDGDCARERQEIGKKGHNPDFEAEKDSYGEGNGEWKSEVGKYSYGEGNGEWKSMSKAFIETCKRLKMLCYYCCFHMRLNIDIVCYVFFLIAYVWNFSLLTIVYPAALFLYALLVNPAPSQIFWLGMLIYTELNILLQYMYRVIETPCVCKIPLDLLTKLGISQHVKGQPFVTSVLPLFLVYLSTLLQSSIKAQDGEWMPVNAGGHLLLGRRLIHSGRIGITWFKRIHGFFVCVKESIEYIGRNILRYLKSVIHGSEAPPHFVQVTVQVDKWPEDGIQPQRIESGFNRLLSAAHRKSCQVHGEIVHAISRVRVVSIEANHAKNNNVITVLEVIFAAPFSGCPANVHYSSLTPAADVASELQTYKDSGFVDVKMFPYPILSVIAGGKREVDLYAYIFGTDLAVFFLVALFYQSVVKKSPEILQMYQLEDQFPKEFVFVLMTVFILIIVDRVIYLWSFAMAKVLFYIFSLCLFTYTVNYYAWKIVPKDHTTGIFLLRLFYLTKALSLSLQALQIKYGLPHKSALFGQFLTREVSVLNHIGFRLYRSLPFLFELRCFLDWSCTTTALTMYDWFKLEDIYASLFLVQCDSKLFREKHIIGEKQGIRTKFFSGICLFLVLICAIWAPMLMYSSGNPTNLANPILDVQTQIDILTKGGRFTLYKNSLCQLMAMQDVVAAGFDLDENIAGYDIRDAQLICCNANSDFLWLIPPPTLSILMDLLQDDVVVVSKWDFNRQRPKTKELAVFSNFTYETSNYDLRNVIEAKTGTLRVPNLYPKYFRVTGTGEVRALENLEDNKVSGNLTLNHDSLSWWGFSRDNSSVEDACGSLNGPVAVAVSEEVAQGILGETLSRFSIASLYITFVLALGRFIRLQFADLRMRIPFENLPSCDRLIAICEDIYAARAAGELKLEEGIFGTLVKIYRSPHVLFEYTKRE